MGHYDGLRYVLIPPETVLLQLDPISQSAEGQPRYSSWLPVAEFITAHPNPVRFRRENKFGDQL